MITARIQYKRKKLTLDQKVLKKVISEMAKVVVRSIKDSVKDFQDSGALRYSIAAKIVSKNPSKVYAIIGTKSHYLKVVAGRDRIPNTYAMKIENVHHHLSNNVNSKTVGLIQSLLRTTYAQIGLGE